jgi:hypothetical protein
MAVKRVLTRHSVPFLFGWALQRAFRLLTARWRTLPDFIIIGAQRSGTTSLYNYLAEHPNILPAFMKETHFFDNYFRKGMTWYQAYFPSTWYKNHGQQHHDGDLITGEATPYYLFYPHAPQRVLEAVPNAKLIVVLRDPVHRAYSHYHHEVNEGFESLSFEEALEREARELPSETETILKDEDYLSFFHQHYTYLSRGIYVDQLERWTRFFPKEQILVLESKDFDSDPAATLRQVIQFLNLPSWELSNHKKYHLAQYTPMEAATRERLVAYFEPHNRRLYEFLGIDLGWER